MTLIKIDNLTKKFNNKEVLTGINLNIEQGKTKVIMGGSGCGKTTLIRCISRLEEADSGAIYFHGQDITKPETNLHQLRQKIGFVFQNFALFRHLSVLDNVSLGLQVVQKMSKKEAKEKAAHYLKKFAMELHLSKHPNQLSGGQKQRVALARALVMEPEVVIFDEPTSALDPMMTREVALLINSLQDEQITLICVTHDISLAEQISKQISFMSHGVITQESSLAELKDSENQVIRDFFMS